MLAVSEKAAAALHETLDQNSTGDGDILRIAQTEQGLALAIGKEHDGDQVVAHDHTNILAIEPDLADALDGATLDLADTPEGPRLVFDAPEQL
jgi:Fe-S cluster assembly iron-binding protein IscA